MRRAVGTILEAGFQMESEAFKTLVEKGREDSLKPLVDEVLKMASLAQPRPLFISADLVLKAAEQLDLAAGPVVPVEGLGHGRRFAEDQESRLEVVFDPTGKLGTTGALDDFLRYFRSRFEKMSALFRQRIDTRSAGTISDALAGGANGRGRFVCMVVEKREKANRIFLTVDDYDDEATVVVGDLVDGIGVYPRQEVDLKVPDIYEQYRLAAKLVGEIPEHMDVVLIPGNHDAVRQALPQPAITKDFAGPVYDSRRVVSLGDPSEVRLDGVDFLLFHGTSLMDILSSAPGFDYQRPVEVMEYQLRARHLAPEYGKSTPIGPEVEDWLVVERVPDIFQSGHIHVPGSGVYRGTTIVNSGAWQGQTDYQKRMGLVPQPGLLPVVNLQSLQVRMMDFRSE